MNPKRNMNPLWQKDINHSVLHSNSNSDAVPFPAHRYMTRSDSGMLIPSAASSVWMSASLAPGLRLALASGRWAERNTCTVGGGGQTVALPL